MIMTESHLCFDFYTRAFFLSTIYICFDLICLFIYSPKKRFTLSHEMAGIVFSTQWDITNNLLYLILMIIICGNSVSRNFDCEA